jgi:hypothetical protein
MDPAERVRLLIFVRVEGLKIKSVKARQLDMPTLRHRYLYIFLDEAGNFDFTKNGTRYLQVGAITKERPFHACKALNELKYDLVEKGLNIEYFHAAEDQQATRNEVFAIISDCLDGVRFDSIYLDKHKLCVSPKQGHRFYVTMLEQLLAHILSVHDLKAFQEVIVFTDRIPVNKKRGEVEKAVKQTLSRTLPKHSRYRIFHHDSKSNFDLQIADYFNWASFRYLRDDDDRAYKVICRAVKARLEVETQADSEDM